VESRLTLFSVVVTGEVHNPTILNPDFLTIRGIVPKEWQGVVQVTQALTTPPFAIVAYSNGISVVVENEKLQVVDVSLPGNPAKSHAVDIASKYVGTLPHVKYKAVGINFQSMAVAESPKEYLKERFIKPGPWNEGSLTLDAVGVKLVYPIPEGGRVIVSLDAAEMKAPAQDIPKSVILVNANFHRDCTGYPADQQVIHHLK
jgi:hypothetical protein